MQQSSINLFRIDDSNSTGTNGSQAFTQSSQESKNKSEVRALLDKLKEDELLQREGGGRFNGRLFPRAFGGDGGRDQTEFEIKSITAANEPPPKILKVRELLAGLDRVI